LRLIASDCVSECMLTTSREERAKSSATL